MSSVRSVPGRQSHPQSHPSTGAHPAKAPSRTGRGLNYGSSTDHHTAPAPAPATATATASNSNSHPAQSAHQVKPPYWHAPSQSISQSQALQHLDQHGESARPVFRFKPQNSPPAPAPAPAPAPTQGRAPAIAPTQRSTLAPAPAPTQSSEPAPPAPAGGPVPPPADQKFRLNPDGSTPEGLHPRESAAPTAEEKANPRLYYENGGWKPVSPGSSVYKHPFHDISIDADTGKLLRYFGNTQT